MTENAYIISVVLICVLMIMLPAIFFNYRLKSRRLATSGQDAAATEGLWDTARRMETRIGYLEQVLDTEVPGWRSRSEMR
jgi:phage shock protein B